MKSDPFQDDLPMPATKSTKTDSKSRLVRPAKTAAAQRPRLEEEEEFEPRVAAKPRIVGSGVAKVVHEEPVTLKKPITSLKKLPRDEAPMPPSRIDEDEVEERTSLPRNPLRR